MNAHDAMQFGPLAISCCALAISAFTAYYNFLRGAQFVSPPMRTIVVARMPQDTGGVLLINVPVSIANTGTRTGVVDSLAIELVEASTNRSEMFYGWQERYLRAPSTSPFYDIPGPMVLKSGEGLSTHYVFHPDSPEFMYRPGIHTLRLYAYLGRKKRILLSEQKFDFQSIVQALPGSTTINMIYSFHMFPRELILLSDYAAEKETTSDPQSLKTETQQVSEKET